MLTKIEAGNSLYLYVINTEFNLQGDDCYKYFRMDRGYSNRRYLYKIIKI